MIKSLVNWSLFVFSLFIVASALAQPGGKGAVGKILALLEDLEGLVTNVQTDVGAVQTGVGAVQADLGAMQLDVDVIQADVDAMQLDLNAMQHLEVRVGVDEDTCAVAGSRPCQGWGHSFDAASSGNHNPVKVVALVTKDGLPVRDLVPSDFHLGTHSLPAGSASMAVCPDGGRGCDFSADAGEVRDGFYKFYVHPAPVDTNWATGTYFAVLTVTDTEGATGKALVEVEIP
jgi:hypothetical protein